MHPLLRRFLFGCFWFGVFSMAFQVVGSAIAGGIAGAENAQPHQSFEQGYKTGSVAGAEFEKRYGRYVTGTAAIAAAVGTLTGILPWTSEKKKGKP